MNKNCVQCQSEFEVSDDDRAFYAEISPVFRGKKYLIPAPTHCFECRLIRKLAWRNECQLYKRKSDLTGKDIVSMYSPDKPYKIFECDKWFSDEFDPLTFGRAVDLDLSIAGQFRDFFLNIPHQHLMNFGLNENCDYTNFVLDSKNMYLCFWGDYSEDSFYNYGFNHLKNCFDNYWVLGGELCFDSVHARRCYQSFYVRYSENISHSSFIFGCQDLSDCFGCVNLRHKQYCIFNEQYSKEDYFERLDQYDLGSFAVVQQLKIEFEKFRLQHPVKALNHVNVENVYGNSCRNSRNLRNCFELYDSENCSYSVDIVNAEHCYDAYGSLKPRYSYEVFAVLNVRNTLFSFDIFDSSNVLYSRSCRNCDHIFGCVGLQHKQYCIFNKQYSQEEYEALVPRIITQMEKTPYEGTRSTRFARSGSDTKSSYNSDFVSEWGEFFPASLSPWGYNETPAQEVYPKKRDEAIDRGYNWSDYEAPVPQVKSILKSSELPDHIRDVEDSILDCGIECQVTGRPFKIVKQELVFYREHSVPLPRSHPDQRRLDRIALSYPRKLFKNDCRKCRKEVDTCFAPGTPEKVYCEQCYLSEVY
jgi:hypothetical protein